MTTSSLFDFNIYVIGDVMLDKYWSGSCERVSPEAPVPVVTIDTDNVKMRAGGAANVAINLSSLGANVNLIGMIGNDEQGKQLTTIVENLGGNCQFVKSMSKPTITKLRVLSCNQQLIRLDFEDQFSEEDLLFMEAVIAEMELNCSAIIFSDYAKGMERIVSSLISKANKHGLPIFIDPKDSCFEKYRGATLLTPNLMEFEAVVGKIESEQQFFDSALRLIRELDLEALLVTRSEAGMTLIQKCGTAMHLPALAKEVYDVTGAGDTVIAVLAAMAGAGFSLEESCIAANAAAGIVVSKLGTSSVSLHELQMVLNDINKSGYYVDTEKGLTSKTGLEGWGTVKDCFVDCSTTEVVSEVGSESSFSVVAN